MLTLRQRGKNKIFSVRGSVTLGDKCITVSERSSGTSDKSAATFFKNGLENDLKNELMFGKKAQVAKATIADAFAAYLSKAEAPNSSDVLRVGILNEQVGTYSLSDPLGAWRFFRAARMVGHAPAGQDRYRSVLQAAINYYYEELGLAKIKIPTIKFNNERVRFLELDERDLLISCYDPHVHRIELDVGKAIINKAPTKGEGLDRLQEMKDYVREVVAAAYAEERQRNGAVGRAVIERISRDAIEQAFAVFEEEAGL